MKKKLKLTVALSTGMLLLFLFEGLFTLGNAFDFKNYTVFEWIIQGVFVVFTLSLSAYLSFENEEV